jgi:outer membrane receptor protein involved in Fe transport
MFRPSVLWIACFACLGKAADAQIISSSQIEIFGEAGAGQNRSANTIDGDRTTAWRAAVPSSGQALVLAYRFRQLMRISRIAFVDDVQNRYALGALEIQTSQNSTDGADGDWTTVDSVPADFTAAAGDFSRTVTIASTRWIRLRLTRAPANGFTLSEIEFHGGAVEPAPQGDSELYRFSTDVVVTASRREQRTIDAPVSMTVLDRRQIESSPAENVADLLRGVPGLNVVEISARDVSVTGRLPTSAFAQGQLVLVDGRSIVNDPNGIAFFDMTPVRFDEIDQIEVLHGPGSSVWGGDALTAVVNMRTKSPRDMRGGLVSGSIGERDTRSVSGRWAGARDDLSYKVSGSYYRQGPWPRPSTLPDGSPMPVDFAYDNPPTTQPRADGRIDWDRAGAGRWSFRTGYARTSGSLLSPTLPLEFEFLYSYYADTSYSSPTLDATVQYRRLVGHATSVLDGSPSDAVSNTPSADITMRRVLGTSQALVFGASSRADFFDIAAAPHHDRRFQVGAFVDDQIALAPQVRLNLGGRLDYIETVGAAFSPRASVVVQPKTSASVRFSYSRAYRPPTLIENYLYVPSSFALDLGTGPPVTIPILAVGNEDLDVARSDGFEVGYSGVLARRHTMTATFYHVVVDGEIQFGTSEFYGPFDPPPGWPLSFVPEGVLPKTSTFRNIGRLRSRGLELGFDSDWSRHLWSRLSYTYQDEPELTEAVAAFPTTVNLPPTHQTSVLVGGANGPWSGSVGVTYVDRAFWSDALDQRFWGFTDSYTLLNAAVSYRLERARSEIVLKGTNLLDRKAQQHSFGDIVRRRVIVEYRVRF